MMRALSAVSTRQSRAYPADRTVPDWPAVHRELRRKGVTLSLVWHECTATHPQGYHSSWFSDQYPVWAGKLDLMP